MPTFARNRLIVVPLLVLAACHKEPEVKVAPPPPEVNVAKPVQQDVPIYMEAIGADARRHGDRGPRARRGLPRDRRLHGGQPGRKKGDLLYTIDPRPFEADVGRRPRADWRRPRRSSPARARTSRATSRWSSKNAISRQELRNGRRASRTPRTRRRRGGEGDGRQRPSSTSATPRCSRRSDGMVGKTEVYAGNAGRPRAEHAAHAASRGSTRSTSASASPSATTSTMRAGAGSAGRGAGRSGSLPFELILADGSRAPHTGHARVRRPQRRRADRHDPDRGGVPQPRRDPAARASTRACASPSTRSPDALLVPQRAVAELQGDLQRRGRRRRRHGRAAQVKPGERVGTLWVIESGLQGRRAGRRRGPAEGAAGHEGQARGRAIEAESAAAPGGRAAARRRRDR